MTNFLKIYHCISIYVLGCSIAQSLRLGPISRVDDDASSRLGLSRQTVEPPNSARPFPPFPFAKQALLLTASELSRIQGVYRVTLEMRKKKDRTKAKCLIECAHCSDSIRDACVACAKCDTKVHRHCFDTHLSHLWASNDDDEVADQVGWSSSSSGISANEYTCDVCQALLDV